MAEAHPIPNHPRFKDMTGQRFNRLTIISYAGHRGRAAWLCRCDCGTEFISPGKPIRHGRTKSCGCWARDLAKSRGRGRLRTPEYGSWRAAKRRCDQATNKSFHNYGGRGIYMCERWLHSFDNFLADMGRRPTPKHTLDRLSNDGPYSPENCRWATRQEQAQNQRKTKLITHAGETMSVSAWARKLGINVTSLWKANNRGVTLEEHLRGIERRACARTRLVQS